MARICVDIYKQHGQHWHCNALQASAAMCDLIRNLHLNTLLIGNIEESQGSKKEGLKLG